MEYNILFTEADIKVLDVALRKRPFEEVVELINKINIQIAKQQAPKQLPQPKEE